jgi:aspartyl/asparaginyl beta-hydroxylase (cupin superfamily)
MLRGAPPAGLGRVVLQVGEPVGVPAAWNRLAAAADGALLAMANDDQVYVQRSWDVALDRRSASLAARHPDGIYCMYFDAGQYPDGGADFPIITRAWFDGLGYFSTEMFQQWQAERWIFDIARRLGRLYPVPGVRVDHRHFQDFTAPFDATYQRHRTTREKSLADHALYIRADVDRELAAKTLQELIDTPQPEAVVRSEEETMTTVGDTRSDDASGTLQGTRGYILQTARRHFANLIDAWHYGGRPEDALACAELAVAQGVWEHPMQRAREYVPGLEAKPLHDPAAFWFIAQLEQRYPEIRAEIEAVLTGPGDPVQRTTDDNALILAGDWKQAHLFRDGAWQEDAARHFPVTRAILDTIPEVTTFSPGVITVSRVLPGSHIMAHCGPTNATLRIHLPIVVPPGVWIRVAGERLTWEEGRCLVFDDSFEHEVGHDGDTDRIVLILDMLHPDLAGRQRERLLQRRRTTEEQMVAFLRDGGFSEVRREGDGLVFEPEPALRDLIVRYMENTGVTGATLDDDKVTWHRPTGGNGG